jgi:peptide/nickel transport system permease protein
MLAFAAKRLGVALLVALTVSLITFSMIYVSGDPAIAIAGEGARAEDIEAIRKFYGFDRPIAVQYVDWLGGALHGDFGRLHAAPAGRRRDLACLPVTMILRVGDCVCAAGHSAGAGVCASNSADRFALTSPWSARRCRPSGSR